MTKHIPQMVVNNGDLRIRKTINLNKSHVISFGEDFHTKTTPSLRIVKWLKDRQAIVALNFFRCPVESYAHGGKVMTPLTCHLIPLIVQQQLKILWDGGGGWMFVDDCC